MEHVHLSESKDGKNISTTTNNNSLTINYHEVLIMSLAYKNSCIKRKINLYLSSEDVYPTASLGAHSVEYGV